MQIFPLKCHTGKTNLEIYIYIYIIYIYTLYILYILYIIYIIYNIYIDFVCMPFLEMLVYILSKKTFIKPNLYIIVWTPLPLSSPHGDWYGGFRILNDGGGLKNLHINGRVRHNGERRVDLKMKDNPFQSNFGPNEDTYQNF